MYKSEKQKPTKITVTNTEGEIVFGCFVCPQCMSEIHTNWNFCPIDGIEFDWSVDEDAGK